MRKQNVRKLVGAMPPPVAYQLLNMTQFMEFGGVVILDLKRDPNIFFAPPDKEKQAELAAKIVEGERPTLTIQVYRMHRQDFNVFLDVDAATIIEAYIDAFPATKTLPQVQSVRRVICDPREFKLVYQDDVDGLPAYAIIQISTGKARGVTADSELIGALTALGIRLERKRGKRSVR